MKVCPFPSSHQRYHLSFRSIKKTDRKRVVGFEFLEPAELNKALCGSSCSLGGANQRTQSESTLIAHSTPTGSTTDLGSRAFSEARVADFHVRKRVN